MAKLIDHGYIIVRTPAIRHTIQTMTPKIAKDIATVFRYLYLDSSIFPSCSSPSSINFSITSYLFLNFPYWLSAFRKNIAGNPNASITTAIAERKLNTTSMDVTRQATNASSANNPIVAQ